MNEIVEQPSTSQIQSFFAGKTIFLTGASGFLGKLTLEKLLRTCDVKKVFVLLREKKGVQSEDRIRTLLDGPCGDRLRKTYPNYLEKLFLIHGDISLPNLGLSPQHQKELLEQTQVVFHYAATVRFDEPLKKAVITNVGGVRELLKLAKSMEKLQSFVYVSTAFSNCGNPEIREEFYEPGLEPNKLIELVNCWDDNILQKITPSLIKNWPNTYAFTKCVAEHVINTEGGDIPIAVVRPSIVIASYKEPLPGYNATMYGISGVYTGVALGILRCMWCNGKLIGDLIPVDYSINMAIVASWKLRQRSLELMGHQDEKTLMPKIYNCVSSCDSPISWEGMLKYALAACRRHATRKMIWYPILIIFSNKYLNMLMSLLLHNIPGYFLDLFAIIMGKKPILTKTYNKIDKYLMVTSYFCNNEWKFENNNTVALWEELSPTDKKLFPFNVSNLDWEDYFDKFILGSRVHLLQDPIETLPQARRKLKMFQALQYFIIFVLVCLATMLVGFVIKNLMQICN